MPADARGRWIAEIPELGGRWQFDVAQKFQELDVDARAGSAQMVVSRARLRGEDLRMAVTGLVGGKAYNLLFSGRISGRSIEGDVRVSDGENVRKFPWKANHR